MHLGTGAVTFLVGVLKQQTGSFPVALLPLCALTAIGCALVFWIGRDQLRASSGAVATAPAGH